MSMVAFPVRQTEDGIGCTDIMMRTIYAALYPDTGVITGLGVTGGNTTAYTVAAGVAVCSKGDADGTVIAPYEGGTVSASANSASNPRIDVVWLCHHDVTQGDSDNYVTLGVTEGTPAASPTEPDIPSYATKLQAMTMPANATTTASATKYGYVNQAVPYGATLGVVNGSDGGVYTSETGLRCTLNQNWGTEQVESQFCNCTFNIPGRRLLQFNVTVTAGANGGQYVDGDGSVYSNIYVDGKVADTREVRLRKANNAISQFYQFVMTVDAGVHTVAWKYKPNACSSTRNAAIRMYYTAGGWAGQVLQIIDLGPAS